MVKVAIFEKKTKKHEPIASAGHADPGKEGFRVAKATVGQV